MKMRRQHIWLVLLISVPILAKCATTGKGSIADGYTRSFYGAPLYNAILMPILCATIASRICENEYEGHAFKQLMTMQKPRELFTAKFVVAALLMAIVCCVQPITILVTGKMYHYADAVTASDILFFAFSQYIVCIFFIIVIQIISLYVENQFVPMSIGVILSLLGLFSMFFPPSVMRFMPSSYFALLNFVGMNWDRAGRSVSYYRMGYPWGYVAILAAVIIALYTVSLRWFVNKEN
ncbi:ABC transporter permease [Alloscardovia venturai]